VLITRAAEETATSQPLSLIMIFSGSRMVAVDARCLEIADDHRFRFEPGSRLGSSDRQHGAAPAGLSCWAMANGRVFLPT